MPPFTRATLRLAQLVQTRIITIQSDRLATTLSRMTTMLAFADDLKSVQRQLGVCRDRDWMAGAYSLQRRAVMLLEDLPAEAMDLRRMLNAQQDPHVPTLRELLEDLEQLEEEFDSFHYDADKRILSVQTQSITLEDILLGPFKIDLHLPDLPGSGHNPPYRVIALDPHPAATNDAVTHPHVSEKRLCEGEAAAPIRAALEAGRLCDFFLLVRSVLNHYNSHSPFVALANWFGVSCYDCGNVTSQDDLHYCEGCEHDICDRCSSYCRSCDTTYCHECLTNCPGCGESTCSSCLHSCSGCDRSFCRSCLEDDLCPQPGPLPDHALLVG